LTHRLAIARRGADLLDHKLRILRVESQRLALLAGRTSAAWVAANRDADLWLHRAELLGGQRAVRLARDGVPADVQIAWAQSMGVRYPAEATCTLPPVSTASPPGNAAIPAAREAFRRALEAAVQQAVAEAAVEVVRLEEAATRRRLRAIEERWIPRLDAALAETQLALDEQEHADGVRLRWAADQQRDPDPPDSSWGAA
jgi:V/A-type H+-transporting ATPase subunit D